MGHHVKFLPARRAPLFVEHTNLNTWYYTILGNISGLPVCGREEKETAVCIVFCNLFLYWSDGDSPFTVPASFLPRMFCRRGGVRVIRGPGIPHRHADGSSSP